MYRNKKHVFNVQCEQLTLKNVLVHNICTKVISVTKALVRYNTWYQAPYTIMHRHTLHNVTTTQSLNVHQSTTLGNIHTVHSSADLSLWLDSPISGHPHIKANPPILIRLLQFHLERWGMDVQTRWTKAQHWATYVASILTL